MATDSSPPNPSNNHPPNPVSEPAQAIVNDPQATAEPPKEISSKSVFVNSQPIREEQVQNAVNFLSHPRVRGSPIVHRRNFLEKKGLTKEEIDEAFRRVPDQSPVVASGQSSTTQDAQATPAINIQAQGPTQTMQPMPATQSSVMSTMARRFHWSHAVLAVGFLAISGAGTIVIFKNSVIPRLKSWIRTVVLDDENAVGKELAGKPSLVEEAAAAAKAAAAAAADVAKASQDMLITKNEEKKSFAEFVSLLDMQLQEMKTMRTAITKLEGQSYIAGRNQVREDYLDGSVGRSRFQPPVGSRSEYDMRSVRSVSPPASIEPPHPKSYMEIMDMVQRGERPPNVRDIDDRPPNPNQPISNSTLVPRAKQKNTRITEIENGDSQNFGSGSNGTTNTINIGPTQRRWIPPQPPPVSMPEAAVAIRQPKSNPKEVNLNAEEAAQPMTALDELQRITQESESGGQVEMNGGGGSSEINFSELQADQITEV
ncbi:unnamed protein product [Amaranthus hypochondriacus]